MQVVVQPTTVPEPTVQVILQATTIAEPALQTPVQPTTAAAPVLLTFEQIIAAAESGDVPAMYQAGCCYQDGKDTDEDMDAALGWYLKAAEAGHADAINKIHGGHVCCCVTTEWMPTFD